MHSFSCETGYPKILVSNTSDEGNQLIKVYGDMKMNFTNLRSKQHRDMGVEFELNPIQGHNVTGRVEGKIREVR